MLLDINRKLLARSSRVKAIDFHPTQPWVIAGLYTGNVFIWNHETGALVKTFEVTEVPVRSVAFIARKNWFVCGADDFHLRVYNYNTQERIASFEAHPDYIRCLAVHPTQPLVITGSDDMTIKLWDWEKGWKCIQTFEGHTHYIMNIAFNPKDNNQFASACLDRTVKIWQLGSSTANFTLEAHDKGVNYVEYYHGGEKPYLVTCGDDRLVKIWDYHSKSCIQVLEGHTSNVSFAIFHPSLPIIVSGSEDGTVKIWHSSTYRLENTLNYGLERCWCVAYNVKGNDVGFGFDEGAVVVKLGKEEPSVSMDNAGKVVFARNSEIVTTNIQAISTDEEFQDGQKIVAPVRDLGTTEIYAQSLQHSPNGRFVTVCGDGEYIIYTALAWRNKAFGPGVGFAWAADSNTYAVRDGVAGSKSPVKVYRNFKERAGLIKGINYATSGIWGGALLCVKGNGFVCFYDWENGALVRRIEVDAESVSWSPSGNLVAVASADSFYVLRFSRDEYINFVDNGGELGDEGVEDAFELIAEVNESVRTGKWLEDCFIYTTANNRLNYLVGTMTNTISHFDTQMYLLGYLPQHNRIYVCDKDVNIAAYSLALSVIEYQTAILRGDTQAAEALLPSIPNDQRNRIARFLEQQDMKELALEVSTDIDQKFELALSLDDLQKALTIIEESTTTKKGGAAEPKWRSLGDRALALWNVELAAKCFKNAGDLPALLLIYSSLGDREGMRELAEAAKQKGLNNVAFAALLELGDTNGCIDLLISTDRIPEAAFFARTYAPSQASRVVKAWKSDLESKKKQKIAVGIADPEEDADLFGDEWQEALSLEKGGPREDYIPAGQQEDLLQMDEEDAADMVEKLKIGEDEEVEHEEDDEYFVEPENGVMPQTNGTAKVLDVAETTPLQVKKEESEEEDLLL